MDKILLRNKKKTKVNTPQDVILQGMSKEFKIAHYHSWVAEKDSLPNCLSVTSENKDGLIMSVSHKKYDVKGIQFHPESILTEN